MTLANYNPAWKGTSELSSVRSLPPFVCCPFKDGSLSLPDKGDMLRAPCHFALRFGRKTERRRGPARGEPAPFATAVYNPPARPAPVAAVSPVPPRAPAPKSSRGAVPRPRQPAACRAASGSSARVPALRSRPLAAPCPAAPGLRVGARRSDQPGGACVLLGLTLCLRPPASLISERTEVPERELAERGASCLRASWWARALPGSWQKVRCQPGAPRIAKLAQGFTRATLKS